VIQGSVLIVEDDSALRHSLHSTLQALGFSVGDASNGENGLLELRQNSYDVVLLDMNMPGIGGMATCHKMRELYPRLPIIVLTVLDREEDKVRALDAGADDYVTKPFQLSELAARIRAAVRRVRTPVGEDTRALQIGDVALDPVTHRVTKHDEELHLTPKEFELLHLLMQHAGKPLAHNRLLKTIWGQEYGGEREYLRTYISQLRKKIEDDPAEPQYLLTENYVGYRFRQE
jgi:two-component system, OmpR family, KDP operon response regulator KdpE